MDTKEYWDVLTVTLQFAKKWNISSTDRWLQDMIYHGDLAVCDKCLNYWADGMVGQRARNKYEAMISAIANGWVSEGDKLYCPECAATKDGTE